MTDRMAGTPQHGSPATPGAGRTLAGVQPIERMSAAEAVRARLLAMIESGELSIGDRLPSEHELARSFGVSRPVIRESLGSLRSVGLIESRSGSGSFVRATTATRSGLLLGGEYSAAELHEVRREIEIPGAALAAVRRTDEQLERLTEIVEGHAYRRQIDDWVRDDLILHVTLAEATGNRVQARLVAELRELQSEQSYVMAQLRGGLGPPIEEHTRILDAVHRRDAEAARAAMAAHLDAIQARSLSIGDEDEGDRDAS